MDLGPFSDFTYQNTAAWQDFLLLNNLSHENYNLAFSRLGIEIAAYPLLDIGATKEGISDWLETHYLMHKSLAANAGLGEIPDLSDVEVHSEDEFYTWLQQHAQQHQSLDYALNL